MITHSSYNGKVEFALTKNIQKFIKDSGLDNVGFLTLTFKNKVFKPSKATTIFNRLNTRVNKKFFRGWIRVLEQHEDGSLHLHLVVDLGQDIRTGFDFVAFDASRMALNHKGQSPSVYDTICSATGEDHPLRSIFTQLQKRLRGYGFGRIELTPVRSDTDAVPNYMTKILKQGLELKQRSKSRIRSWAMSRNVKRAVRLPFAWTSARAQLWRRKVAAFAEHLGCHDLDEMTALAGPRWLHNYKAVIMEMIPLGPERSLPWPQPQELTDLALKGESSPIFEDFLREHPPQFPIVDRVAYNESILQVAAEVMPRLALLLKQRPGYIPTPLTEPKPALVIPQLSPKSFIGQDPVTIDLTTNPVTHTGSGSNSQTDSMGQVTLGLIDASVDRTG
jgi:hypothetical protein